MIVEATFIKRSFQHHTGREYLLFQNIIVDGEFMIDHKWIKSTIRLNKVDLVKGVKISFTARVKTYLDSKDVTKSKIGFHHIRSVKIIGD